MVRRGGAPRGEAVEKSFFERRIRCAQATVGEPVLGGTGGKNAPGVLPEGAGRGEILERKVSGPKSVDRNDLPRGESGTLCGGGFIGEGEHVPSGFRLEQGADFVDERMKEEARVTGAHFVDHA